MVKRLIISHAAFADIDRIVAFNDVEINLMPIQGSLLKASSIE